MGCVPIEITAFINWLTGWIFGIAGGISFLLMVYGFIKLSVSGDDPKAMQGAKETITSAITGLLISIFCGFILRLLLINILHLPGIS